MQFFAERNKELEKAKKKKKWLKPVIIIAVLAVIIAVASKACVSSIGGTMQMMNTATCDRASVQNLISYVSVSGTVSSSNTINITGNIDQKVKSLNVKVGDSVKKGDILCEFDSSALQEEYDTLEKTAEKSQGAENYTHNINVRNLNRARSDKQDSLNKAQQSINSAESKRDKAYNDYNEKVEEFNRLNAEAGELYAQILKDGQNAVPDTESEEEYSAYGAVGQTDERLTKYQELKAKAEAINASLDAMKDQLSVYDDAVDSAYDAYREVEKSADNVIQSAQDTIDAEQFSSADNSTQSQLKKLKERIEECTVKAPEDGVITQLNVTVGSIPTNANIIVLENTDELVIKGKVNESDILRVEEGLPVEIKTGATQDEVINGKVKRIEKIISSNTSAMQETSGGYTVEISIDDKDSPLLIGMNASAKIILDRQDEALSVPYDAVQGGENDGYFVFVAVPAENDKMYRIEKRSIEKGFEGDYYTEVKSGDVKENDIVLTNPSGISEGDVIPLDVSEVQS